MISKWMASWGGTVGLEDVVDLLVDAVELEVVAGEVDRDGRIGPALAPPLLDVLADLPENLEVHLVGEVAALECVDELRGGERAENRVVPAGEGLEALELAREGAHDGLVGHVYPALVDSAVHVAHDVGAHVEVAFHAFVVAAPIAAEVARGGVAGDLCPVEDLDGAVLLSGDAVDARMDLGMGVALRHCVVHRADEIDRPDRGTHHVEMVGLIAHGVVCADRRPNRLGHASQKVVAALEAVLDVVGLEVGDIEVDHIEVAVGLASGESLDERADHLVERPDGVETGDAVKAVAAVRMVCGVKIAQEQAEQIGGCAKCSSDRVVARARLRGVGQKRGTRLGSLERKCREIACACLLLHGLACEQRFEPRPGDVAAGDDAVALASDALGACPIGDGQAVRVSVPADCNGRGVEPAGQLIHKLADRAFGVPIGIGSGDARAKCRDEGGRHRIGVMLVCAHAGPLPLAWATVPSETEIDSTLK